jgi:hypothetical protein
MFRNSSYLFVYQLSIFKKQKGGQVHYSKIRGDNWVTVNINFAYKCFPSYSFDNSSSTGPTMRHGPHHSAPKSSKTGFPDLTTNSLKF